MMFFCVTLRFCFHSQASETISAREAEESHDVIPDEPVDLGELLDEVVSSIRAKRQKKNLFSRSDSHLSLFSLQAAGVWEDQIKSIQAEQGEHARIPPPPELILCK